MIEDASIRSLIADFVSAWNTGNAQLLGETYAEDGSFIDPFGTAIAGRQAITEHFFSMLETLFKGTRTTFIIERVRPLGESVEIADGTQLVLGRRAPDGNLLRDVALHFTGVLTRQDDRWLFLDGRLYAFRPTAGG